MLHRAPVAHAQHLDLGRERKRCCLCRTIALQCGTWRWNVTLKKRSVWLLTASTSKTWHQHSCCSCMQARQTSRRCTGTARYQACSCRQLATASTFSSRQTCLNYQRVASGNEMPIRIVTRNSQSHSLVHGFDLKVDPSQLQTSENRIATCTGVSCPLTAHSLRTKGAQAAAALPMMTVKNLACMHWHPSNPVDMPAQCATVTAL